MGPGWIGPVVLGVVCLVLIAAGVWFFVRDDRPRAEAGEVFQQHSRTRYEAGGAPATKVTAVDGESMQAVFSVTSAKGPEMMAVTQNLRVDIGSEVSGAPDSAVVPVTWGASVP